MSERVNIQIHVHSAPPERSIANEQCFRVDGRALCTCGVPYRDHTCIADGGFRRACDGRLVKT